MQQLLIKIDEHLELRGADPAFAEALYRTLQTQRAYLQPWLPWLEQARSVTHVRRLLHDFAAFNEGGQRLTTFISLEGKLVGSIGLIRIYRHHRRAEIGYWLQQEYQGRGIITRSCRALIKHSFLKLQLNRLEMHVPTQNVRSLNVPTRLGFRHEGTLRQYALLNNVFQDMEAFALLRKEWKEDAWNEQA